jgi:hypothetical protein
MEWDPEGDGHRRRDSRNRIVAAVAIVLAIFGLILRYVVAHERDRQRDRDFEIAARVQRDLQPSIPGLSDVPAATSAALDDSTRQVCKHLLECGGRTPAEVTAQLDDCVKVQTRQAVDAMSRDLLTMLNKRVLAACGSFGCDQFPNCYMDTMKQLAGATGPPKQLDPAVRAKVVALVCDVVAENAGKVPDLHGPNPSPKVQQLNDLIRDLDVSAIADVMKEAMASCSK